MHESQYMEEYPLLINSILKYIKKVKEHDSDISFLDIIMDYSIKKNLELEYIGDAISSDENFKTLLHKDLEKSKYIKHEKNSSDW
jgi:hypothetical protein